MASLWASFRVPPYFQLMCTAQWPGDKKNADHSARNVHLDWVGISTAECSLYSAVLWYLPRQRHIKQRVELSVIWDAMVLIWCCCYGCNAFTIVMLSVGFHNPCLLSLVESLESRNPHAMSATSFKVQLFPLRLWCYVYCAICICNYSRVDDAYWRQ